MVSSKQLASTVLNLTFEQYFSESEELILELEMKLSDTDFMGIAINAPEKIPVDGHNELPFVLSMRRTGLRAWEVSRDLNCILVASDLNTEKVRFAQVFKDPKAESFAAPADAPRRPEPKGTSAAAILSGLDKADARAILDLPWKSGKFALCVIMYDWVSNEVEVELLGKEELEAGMVRPVFPEPGLNSEAGNEVPKNHDKQVFPYYLACPKTPKLSGLGATFVIESKPKQNALAVLGAFSTKTRENYLPGETIVHHSPDGRDLTVAAVVPMTFAIVGRDCRDPIRFDWAIPVYSEKELQEGEIIEGSFAIDPLMGTDLKLVSGTYMAYIAMGGRVYGPCRFQWFSPGVSPGQSKPGDGPADMEKDMDEDFEADFEDEDLDEDTWT